MVKKRNLLAWAGILGIIIVVSNNIIQFIDILSQKEISHIIIILLATFGVLWNSNLMEKLR